jgi:hypothetical protein
MDGLLTLPGLPVPPIVTHTVARSEMSALGQKRTLLQCMPQIAAYSITSSAQGEQRLIVSSNLVGSSTRFSYRTIASHMF